MLFQVKSYIKFLWNSSNQHGIHSPFVYDLITKCFYDNTNYSEYSFLKKFRDSLLQDSNRIEVDDFGAGSKVFKSSSRQVSKIAKTAGISEKRAKLLFRIVKYFKPESTLELGTSLGLATVAIAVGHPNTNITTLEGCHETATIAKQQFGTFNVKNANLIVTEFGKFLDANPPRQYQFIYFDGNHNKQSTLQYATALLETVTNKTVWIFDDIHWSADMESAWQEIKKMPNVTVAIDTFQWGIVFFRKEQKKEHFTIRV